MKKHITNHYMFLILSTILAACSSSFQLGSPWNPNEAPIFDDGIDLIDKPEKLNGKWAYLAEEELNTRVNLANMIALVSLNSVQTNKNLEGTEDKRLHIEIKDQLFGQTPSLNLHLHSNNTSLGYTLLERHEDRLTGDFIVFIRWFFNKDGSSGHHFHLSPASPQVLNAVKTLIENRKAVEKAHLQQ